MSDDGASRQMASAPSAQAQTREAKPRGKAGGTTRWVQARARGVRALAEKDSRVGEAGGQQAGYYHRCRPPTSCYQLVVMK